MSDVFPAAVYTLCFVTSAACAYLLLRSYRRSGVRLLLWSALCFLFLALNNLAVIFDLLLFPTVDFGFVRPTLSVIAVTLLLYGLIGAREGER